MKRLLIAALAAMLGAGAASADELDVCTTLTDAPPGLDDQLICDREQQHAQELGLPDSEEVTVVSLGDLYELGWELIGVERFQTPQGYRYRVYLEREDAPANS